MPPGDAVRQAADDAAPGLPDLPLDAFGDGDDIKPLPPQVIPDNPPPHEGAMIEVQQTVEPPDLLIVEVLAAAVARPITGTRLVRPDGTITLGWYGDVHVRGLTLPQIKQKIIIHLRKYLTDEALGLLAEDQDGDIVHVPPEESDTVHVDISAYNHQVYYVEGDVNAPGRMPITGNETVIDALTYAGREAPVGNSKDVVLVRPSRPGQPARVYPIDLEAIRRKGDATANLQLFPGDRLLVGRIPIVTETINIDRVAAPTNTLTNTMLQYAFVMKNLREQMDAAKLTPAQRAAMMEAWLAIWSDWTKRGPFEPPTPQELREVFKKLFEPMLVPAGAN
jgi:polysaccharide export outer membrane protein